MERGFARLIPVIEQRLAGAKGAERNGMVHERFIGYDDVWRDVAEPIHGFAEPAPKAA
jgi:hypothetical protein